MRAPLRLRIFVGIILSLTVFLSVATAAIPASTSVKSDSVKESTAEKKDQIANANTLDEDIGIKAQEKDKEGLEDLTSEEILEITKKLKQSIKEKYGVNIYTDGTIPENCRPSEGKSGISGQLLSDREALIATANADSFLSQYPEEFVQKNMKNIYFLNNIKYKDQKGNIVDAGGAFMNAGQPDSIFANYWYEPSLHHEYAHLLAHNYSNSFPSKDWRALYNSKEENPWKNLGPDYQSPYLISQGSIKQYSQTADYEDFATFMEEYFINRNYVTKNAEHYPLVNKKLKLGLDFYKKIGALKN